MIEHLRAKGTLVATDTAPEELVTFSGYASVFDTLIDAHIPTIIQRGAFAETLIAQRDRIKILWQHSAADPIGRPLELREDSHGLFVRGQLSSTPRGQEAAQLLRDGVITEMSIGFEPVDFFLERRPNDTLRHITKLRLWEVSLVTHGANPRARISQVQSRPETIEDRFDALAAYARMLEASEMREAQTREARLFELQMALLDSYARKLR